MLVCPCMSIYVTVVFAYNHVFVHVNDQCVYGCISMVLCVSVYMCMYVHTCASKLIV